jgi:hypothetical protein
MPKQAVSKTSTKPKPQADKTKDKPQSEKLNWKELPMEILSPDEFEAITKANYFHPESQLILKLFLQVNYFWHITRQMQGKPTHLPKDVDWTIVEESAARLIAQTLNQLLTGVTISSWATSKPNGRTRSNG